MPKNKTRSSAKKRFTVTGTGKTMHQRTKLRHKLEHKSSRQTRRLTGRVETAKADAARIRKLLGR
jgi:large subunit ribosomal protein L35